MSEQVYEVEIRVDNNNLYLKTSISTTVINLEHVTHIESSFYEGDEHMVFNLRDEKEYKIEFCGDGATSSLIISEYERWKNEQEIKNDLIKLIQSNPLLSKDELLKKYNMINELSEDIVSPED